MKLEVFTLVLAVAAQVITADDAFNKVLLREEIDVSAAPSFLEESLQLESFAHLTAQERLEHDQEFSFLVHLRASAMQAQSLAELEAVLGGVSLGHYIPHNTFLVHASHRRALELAQQREIVEWVGNLHPKHKVSGSVSEFEPGRMAENDLVVEVAPGQEAAAVAEAVLARAAAQGFTGIQLQASAASRFHLRLSDPVHLELTDFLAHQPELIHVHRLFPAQTSNAYAKTILWDGTETPSENFVSTTVSNNLDGKGHVVGVADSGIARHSCFFKQSTFVGSTAYKRWTASARGDTTSCASDFAESNRKIVQYVTFGDRADSNTNQGGHGTHVTGSILGSLVGNEESELGSFKGVAPAARVAFFDVADGYSEGLSFPLDLQKDMLNWSYTATARVHSNSWGRISPTGINEYDSASSDYDSFMWKHKDFLIVVAAGNSGGCNVQGTVGSPANAKNVLTVGASLNSNQSWRKLQQYLANDPLYSNYWVSRPEDFNSDTVAAFSSIGPTTDDRIKPDVMAPGYYVTSAFNSPSDSQCSTVNLMETIRVDAGTSQATPLVAGSALLVRQYFLEGFFPSGSRNSANAFTPSASLLKAVIINSADNMKGVKHQIPFQQTDFCTVSRRALGARPSIYQGFGRVSLDSVLPFADQPSARSTFIPSLNSSASNVFYDSSISTGKTHTFQYCTIPGSTEELRVTLVWTDAPPSSIASRELVNDLDLTVDIAGTTYYGNGQGSYKTEVGIRLSFYDKDSVNPVETVYYTPSATASAVSIVVKVAGFNVPMGPQPYSLVISGGITEGACGSTVTSNPAITKNSVIPVPTPANTVCQNVVAIDDSVDETSTGPTFAPRGNNGGLPLFAILGIAIGAVLIVAFVLAFLILRKPKDKKPLLQEATGEKM